ncbi:Renalase, oxidases 1,2-dihydro- and 1,6-dihydro-beta-NAD(P)H isomers back to NAD(P), partial [uncultured Rubrobacteraceae bacterium]
GGIQTRADGQDGRRGGRGRHSGPDGGLLPGTGWHERDRVREGAPTGRSRGDTGVRRLPVQPRWPRPVHRWRGHQSLQRAGRHLRLRDPERHVRDAGRQDQPLPRGPDR